MPKKEEKHPSETDNQRKALQRFRRQFQLELPLNEPLILL